MAPVGAFSMMVKTDGSFAALPRTQLAALQFLATRAKNAPIILTVKEKTKSAVWMEHVPEYANIILTAKEEANIVGWMELVHQAVSKC